MFFVVLDVVSDGCPVSLFTLNVYCDFFVDCPCRFSFQFVERFCRFSVHRRLSSMLVLLLSARCYCNYGGAAGVGFLL